MNRIEDSFVQQVRQRTDIVDVVGQYVQLRRSGHSYVGLCPFHNERTPSLSVSADQQMYYCFGCGAGGTVFRFLMDVEGLSFVEVVHRLAAQAGLMLPVAEHNEQAPQHTIARRMKEAHELAAKFYSYILMNSAVGAQALGYLQQRGLSRQTLAEFQLGVAPVAPTTLVSFLLRRGVAKDLLVQSGLAVEMGAQLVDRFRNRVIIPIADAQASVVAFGGRTMKLDTSPKYLNSPETPIFHKGELLFNLHRARRDIRKTGTVVLLEGYMDVLSAWQAGVHNCVASLGTSFSAAHAARLKASTSRVLIAYDGDQAGRKAAVKALTVAQAAGLGAQVVQFPDGQDPDDYIRQHGADKFIKSLEALALTPVEFLLLETRAVAVLGTEAGRTAFLRAALQVLADHASPIECDAHMRKLAAEFSIGSQALSDELRVIARQARRSAERVVAGREEGNLLPATPGHVKAGNRILQYLLLYPEAQDTLMNLGVDELGSAPQTALLALFYGFRVHSPHGDAAAFIDSLDDDELRGLASSLLIEGIPEYDEGVLASCLDTIRLRDLEGRLLEMARQSDAARRRGDDEAAASLRAEADVLKSAVASLKMSPTGAPRG